MEFKNGFFPHPLSTLAILCYAVMGKVIVCYSWSDLASLWTDGLVEESNSLVIMFQLSKLGIYIHIFYVDIFHTARVI